jgi:hypothetical protein
MTQVLSEVYFDTLEAGQHLRITRTSDDQESKVSDFVVSVPGVNWPEGLLTEAEIDEPIVARLGGSVDVNWDTYPLDQDKMRRISVGERLCLFLPSICPEPVFDRHGAIAKIEIV